MQLSRLVKIVGGRPGMYLGGETIDRLEAFIAGYHFCLDELKTEPDTVMQELRGFNSWLRGIDKDLTESQGWETFFRKRYGEKGGCLKFFEYRAEYEKLVLDTNPNRSD